MKSQTIITLFKIVLAALSTAACGFGVFVGGTLIYGAYAGPLTLLAGIGGMFLVIISLVGWAFFIRKLFA